VANSQAVFVEASNVVLLHPQSSERANALASKTKRWSKRKRKEAKKGVERERVTFLAPQYDLDEPLLKQFVLFMAAECADKTSTDFVEVSRRRTAAHRTAHTSPRHTAPHRTAPRHTAPHRATPHRTAPHRTAPHRQCLRSVTATTAAGKAEETPMTVAAVCRALSERVVAAFPTYFAPTTRRAHQTATGATTSADEEELLVSLRVILVLYILSVRAGIRRTALHRHTARRALTRASASGPVRN
jgi:hypothetical protein